MKKAAPAMPDRSPAMQHDNFIVFTGGPGSGKTTLIAALAAAGHAVSAEAGRSVIQDQAAIGGTGLPWSDRRLFAELMLSHDLLAYRAAQQQRGLVFFDRGIPDVAGYLRLCDLSVPPHVETAAARFRYNASAFIAPPWRDIFHQDRERKQDFAKAARTCDAMRETYGGLGYRLLELPRTPVADRMRFVLDAIKTGAGLA